MPVCCFLDPHWRAAALAGSLFPLVWLGACDSREPEMDTRKVPPGKNTSEKIPKANSPELAAARLELARSRLETRLPDEALWFTVSALDADPSSKEAREMAASILADTSWRIDECAVRFPMPIDRIEMQAPSSLWVSLTGGKNTVVRWNPDKGQVESVMFPIKADGARAMVFDSSHRHVVIQRGGITLLCDARTLKPIRDLGLLPDDVTPFSNIVFSADGLLLAHPARVSESDASVVWQLRDTGTGEILRASEPETGPAIRPVAAHLDRQSLKVLRSDGGLLEMPVSPVEAITITPAKQPARLLHAVYSPSAGAADALVDRGPHAQAERMIVPPGQPMDALSPMVALSEFSWSKHPCVWNGLLAGEPAFEVQRNIIRFDSEDRAPIRLASNATALTRDGERFLTGESDGTLTIHRYLPRLGRKAVDVIASAVDQRCAGELAKLTHLLTGISPDDTRGTFASISTVDRLQLLGDIDFGCLGKAFPDIEFGPLRDAMAGFQVPKPADHAMAPVTDRLARSEPAGGMEEMENAFENADNEAVLRLIQQAGGRDARAAKAFELSLDSTHANWIRACMDQAKDLPPLLRKLAVSRIAWIENRKADAIAGWPDVFPDLTQVRLREDWDGWEQADFSMAMEKLKLCIREVLDALEVPPESTPEQRKAVFERLMDPETVIAVGKPRFARACLHAALAFSKFKDEKETTFQLATIARNLGEAAAPCLRAEAMALTAMGDYAQARERWISLITEHPVAAQEPGDYAEAAYTSFENADPQQAMNILTTGMHRFPEDANFALRAGWVSLLTGNAERAYRFLLTGKQIGYPEEKLENATALLAIAAVQTGASEDAAVFYQDLVAMDPAWQDAATIETLDWPEELKASLRQLVW
jgi:tetratricopeptide (TPR) repeat protein